MMITFCLYGISVMNFRTVEAENRCICRYEGGKQNLMLSERRHYNFLAIPCLNQALKTDFGQTLLIPFSVNFFSRLIDIYTNCMSLCNKDVASSLCILEILTFEKQFFFCSAG